MDLRLLIGTESGLWSHGAGTLDPVEAFTGRGITALAREGARTWGLVDGCALWTTSVDEAWREVARIEGPAATCLGPTSSGLLVGTEQAHLARLVDGKLVAMDSFETVDGRQDWYTPWGDPADVRSIAVAADGTIHVNVHVGGVVRSRDAGRSWTPTVDIEADVHQVLAHPTDPTLVLAAAYEGFGISQDGGDSWQFVTDGMHAHYARAVAVGDDTVFVSASTGPRGRRSALYRRPLESTDPFERCREGLPWFDDNIDTGCLTAAGAVVVFGTEDGRAFVSGDRGRSFTLLAKGLPAVRSVVFA